MKTAFRHFINDIKRGENIDVYIAEFVSVILAVLNIIFSALGVAGTILAAMLAEGILIILGTLAYSTLATRRTLSEFSQAIISLRSGHVLLQDRSAFGSFKDRLDGVNTFWLYGPSLVTIWTANSDLLIEKVRKGGEVRVLIFDPTSDCLPTLAEHLWVRPIKLKTDILTTIEDCKEYLLSERGLGAGKFEVRQTMMMPGYSIVIFNPSEQNGQMLLEYIGYHSPLNERPHIELDAARDRRWFDYYLRQFDELWKSATPYKLDDSGSE